MKNNLIHIGVAGGTLVLAFLVLNPFHILMPTALAMLILAGLFILFGVFTVFVVQERSVDERDEQHRSFAGRAAFLTGSALLMIGVVVEDLAHSLDPWLVIVLMGMITAKIVSRLYSEFWQ